MKKIFGILALFTALLTLAASTPAHKNIYMTRTGHIWFFSSAPLEDIEAHNRQVSSSLNTETGDMAFSVLIKGFEFQKALMQEHFNENYMESDKYPKSTFRGRITDIKAVNFSKNGTYKVKVAGDLTIHGVTKAITSEGTLVVKEGEILAKSSFPVRLRDYNITIPTIVKDKIAEVVDVHVEMNYKPKDN